MGFPHQHSTALESSFRRAQGYTDLWPQLANAFQHLVELIKPICISLERNRWYACRRAWGKWVCRKNVGYIGSVKRYTISLKAPLGWYDFYCEPSTQTTWKKTHTHTHKFRSTHTSPACSAGESQVLCNSYVSRFLLWSFQEETSVCFLLFQPPT